jgi:sensor histidine kinase YesM
MARPISLIDQSPANTAADQVSSPAADAVLRPLGKSFAMRWSAWLLLILAGTISSMLLKYWALAMFNDLIGNRSYLHSWSASLYYSFIYSACIGSLLIYSASRSWAYISRRRFPVNFVLLFISILVPATIGTLLSGLILIAFGQHPVSAYGSMTSHSLLISLLLSLIFGASFYFYENLRGALEATTLQLHKKQLEEERARKLAVAAQLSSLESRVRPHFLFNTLNSISALVRENPERAERMVEQLSALLRFSLDANQRRTVPLRNEIKLVNDYLEIEKTRFNSRLRFTFDIPPELNAAAVPPFAVQTLVENSVKHAIAPRRTGGEIRITARVEGNHLKLEVLDDGPGFTPQAIIAGHGLDTLQARLTALFPEDSSLNVESVSDGAKVTLTLPRG